MKKLIALILIVVILFAIASSFFLPPFTLDMLYEANSFENLYRNYGAYSIATQYPLEGISTVTYCDRTVISSEYLTDYYGTLGYVFTPESEYYFDPTGIYADCSLANVGFADSLEAYASPFTDPQSDEEMMYLCARAEGGYYAEVLASDKYVSAIFGDNFPESCYAAYYLLLRSDLTVKQLQLTIIEGDSGYELPVVYMAVNVDDISVPEDTASVLDHIASAEELVTLTFIADPTLDTGYTYTNLVAKGDTVICTLPDEYTVYSDEACTQPINLNTVTAEADTTYYVTLNAENHM